jgi:hypothetical protein
LNGEILSDDVCIDPALRFCATNFTFFGITNQSGLEDLDGILGLSPIAAQNGPSFMGALQS